ncbi:MAG: hypothetical protein WCP28_04295 [Actinomycetes bacterium]
MEVEDRTTPNTPELPATAEVSHVARSSRARTQDADRAVTDRVVDVTDVTRARRAAQNWQVLRQQMKLHGIRYRDMIDYLLGFLPWVGFFVVSVVLAHSSFALVLACLVGLGLSVAMALPTFRLGPRTTLDIGGLVLFPSVLVIQLITGVFDQNRWSSVLVAAALVVAVGVGLVRGTPFTAVYARPTVPQVQWDDSGFLAFQKRISRLWFSGLALVAMSILVSTAFSPDSVLSVFFGWVVPTAIVGFVLYQQVLRITTHEVLRDEHVRAHFGRQLNAGEPILDFVSHVTAIGEPQEVKALHRGLVGLGLVKAWEFPDGRHGTSGGVRLGNLNIALAASSEAHSSNGLAFEPTSLNGLGVELDRRGLAHGAVSPLAAGDRRDYVETDLANLSSPGSLTVELSAAMVPVRTESPVAPPNAAGIVDVRQVLIGVTNRRARAWQELFAPTRLDRNPVRFSQGPQVQFVASARDGIESVLVAVTDLQVARAALLSAGLVDDTEAIHGSAPEDQRESGSLWCGSLRIDLVQV